MVSKKRLFDLSSNQKQKQFEKKFATLAAGALFEVCFFNEKSSFLIFFQDFSLFSTACASMHSLVKITAIGDYRTILQNYYKAKKHFVGPPTNCQVGYW